MKKLDKKSFKFLQIAYVIWNLLDYYCTLFNIDPGDDPLELATKSEIRTNGALTYVRVIVPRISNAPLSIDVLDSSEILNDYLRIVLLPNQKELAPYSNGKTIYDVVEPLYVEDVAFSEHFMALDVLYIDNPVAFHHVRTYKI